MQRLFPGVAAALALATAAPPPVGATTFLFDQKPFKGTTALETPGRQIVGNEISIPVFDFDADLLAFSAPAFGLDRGVGFFSAPAGAIPAAGRNVILLTTLDFDGDPGNGLQLNAGQAANLIAADISESAPGFFIYFNSFLNLPRLVFSTDLSSNQADLKILARFTGMVGDQGRADLARFGPGNFAVVPEPANWALMVMGFGLLGAIARRRQPAALA